jgi:hypothetical protein
MRACECESDIDRIKELCKLEAEVINLMFEVSEDHGVNMLLNSTRSFEAFCRTKDKMFIRGMSIEYRTFVTTLLTLIDARYRATALAKMLMS